MRTLNIWIFAFLLPISILKAQPDNSLPGPDLDGDFVITLDSAFQYESRPMKFYLRANQGEWPEDIHSSSIRNHNSTHRSKLTKVQGTKDEVTLETFTHIPEDEWGREPQDATFKMNLIIHSTPNPDWDSVSGDFTGINGAEAVKGVVFGRFFPGKVPVKIPNFTFPATGEHPRLFFRKSDVPALRAKAETTEGKKIIDGLKEQLADRYTLWHGAGYGFLYQLTEDASYAQKAREAVENALNGSRDINSSYAFRNPDGALRAGPSVAAIAMAYDLSYDGWDEEFREMIAGEIQYYGKDEANSEVSLRSMSIDPRHPSGSNHYGAQVGGAGLAVLAIMGDPGTNLDSCKKYLRYIRKNAVRNLHEGFGDGGYFAEHSGPSHVSSNTAFVPYLQAELIAGGMDFVSQRPNARWITLRWGHDLLSSPGGPVYPIRRNSGFASYGSEKFDEMGSSHGGQFAQGMGTLNMAQKRAMAWVYYYAVASQNPNRPYGIGVYPHRSIFSLVNWPLAKGPLNPEGIIPNIQRDAVFGYHSFRDRWLNHQDILVTSLSDWHLRWGHIDKKGMPEPIMIWGRGIRTHGPATFFMEKTFYFHSHENVTSTFSTIPVAEGIASRTYPDSLPTAVFIDFDSEVTGLDALVVTTGPKAHKVESVLDKNGYDAGYHEVQTQNHVLHIIALHQASLNPEFSTSGDTLFSGNRKLYFNGDFFQFNSESTSSLISRVKNPKLPFRLSGNRLQVNTIGKPEGELRIFDLKGAALIRQAIPAGKKVWIDLSNLSKGHYSMDWKTEKEQTTRLFSLSP